MEKEIKEINKTCATRGIEMATMNQKIDNLDEKFDIYIKDDKKWKENLNEKFVNKNEFWPVKIIVYGLVGTILLSVIGAIVALVVTL